MKQLKIKDIGDDVFVWEFPNEKEDSETGSQLAHVIGDTSVSCDQESPLSQWTKIVKILRIHNLVIKERKEAKHGRK